MFWSSIHLQKERAMNTKSKVRIALGILVALVLSEAPGEAAWWVPVLSCDNGSARVEVDLGERRNVQIVIANSAIRNYLNSTGIRDFSPYYGDFIGAFMQNGIFQSSQFNGFRRAGFSDTCYGGFAATVNVSREGAGLKVVGYQEATEGCCFEMDSGGTCTLKAGDVQFKELGNWYFQLCEELPIPK
jgi:hypothetical protein